MMRYLLTNLEGQEGQRFKRVIREDIFEANLRDLLSLFFTPLICLKFHLRSHSRLPFLVEDQHATAAVDVIDLWPDIIISHNILLTCHLRDAGPGVQVHCPVSTLTTLAALDI